MRYWAFLMGSIAAICTFSNPANCQTPRQLQKQRALGDGLARDIDHQVERINDPSIIQYLQRVENRLALAAGVQPLELRLSRNQKPSAVLLPNRVLYLSSGLLQQLQSEAELAGLLAHETAHGPWEASAPAQAPGTIVLFMPPCVLSSQAKILPTGWIKDRREREQQATATALKTLQAARYDPEALLELLSKLSYNYPDWSKAIVSGDLFDLRASLETTAPPADGYLIDGSEFQQMHARLESMLGSK